MSPKYEIPVFLQTAAAHPEPPAVEKPGRPDTSAAIAAINKSIREHIVLRDQLRADQKLLRQKLKDLHDLELKESATIARLQGERTPLYRRQKKGK